QAGELGVGVEEVAQKCQALLDQAVDLAQAVAVLGDLLRPAGGVEEGADRRDGVVDLVIDDPDGFLPYPDFLPPQLGRETLDEQEAVPLGIEMENALAEVERLVVAAEER